MSYTRQFWRNTWPHCSRKEASIRRVCITHTKHTDKHAYVTVNFECFVEGTRSRLGKLLQPKLGVVKIILDALIDNRFSDCHIVPISLGYDKIIETSSYATELLGTPKEKESLW